MLSRRVLLLMMAALLGSGPAAMARAQHGPATATRSITDSSHGLSVHSTAELTAVTLDSDDIAVQHYLVFCARRSPGWGTGHAFVVWAIHDERSGNICCESFGFYPGSERVLSRFFVGTGRVLSEWSRSASTDPAMLTHHVVVPVDPEAFAASLEVRDHWQHAGEDYNLLTRNCTHFTYDVSRAIGCRTPRPAWGERPPHYLQRLTRAIQGGN